MSTPEEVLKRLREQEEARIAAESMRNQSQNTPPAVPAKPQPIVYTAEAGDTLCGIAYKHGLNDCKPLRAEAANAYILKRKEDPAIPLAGDKVTIPDFRVKQQDGSTELQHRFVVRRGNIAMIRFVRSTNSPTPGTPLTELNISNYITNKAGAPDGAVNFPGEMVRKFHLDADQDLDAFQIEVFDLNTTERDLKVDVEVLLPTYNAAGSVTGYTQFPAGLRADREIKDLIVSKQDQIKFFRSSYMRLVTDKIDKDMVDWDAGAQKNVSHPGKQTLLVTDMYDQHNSQVEILDQRVKATYKVPTCKEDPQCKSIAVIPVGTDRKRLKIAVHILREISVAAPPVATIPNTERGIYKWLRRLYAQASIAPKMVKPIREVRPLFNLVSISNIMGNLAAGDGEVGFTIFAPPLIPQVIGPIKLSQWELPVTTAFRLASLVKPPFKAIVTLNPPCLGHVLGSADILIENNGNFLYIDDEKTTDSQQSLTVGRPDPASLVQNGGVDALVGSIEYRTILKNYAGDSPSNPAKDWLDIFVIGDFSGNTGLRGQAIPSGTLFSNAKITNLGTDPVRHSVFVYADSMKGTDFEFNNLAHEIGHVLGDIAHVVNAPAQIMKSGTNYENYNVTVTKRFRDGLQTFDAPAGDFNLVSRFRVKGALLLEDW
jgi:hypothetical protein